MLTKQFYFLKVMQLSKRATSHNIPLSDGSNPNPAQQVGDVGQAVGEVLRSAAALDIQAHQWPSVGAAQVKAPVDKGEAHTVGFIE